MGISSTDPKGEAASSFGAVLGLLSAWAENVFGASTPRVADYKKRAGPQVGEWVPRGLWEVKETKDSTAVSSLRNI